MDSEVPSVEALEIVDRSVETDHEDIGLGALLMVLPEGTRIERRWDWRVESPDGATVSTSGTLRDAVEGLLRAMASRTVERVIDRG